ncbi:hypothetical protein BT63DRAFT_412006 [Microthyrium microscopicum]|uniref:F-box domain-containing protein n=1 Tax=Microthyrium microscopicum TaxID=703497 RepID=A0A6A6UFG3_9PEZI|nr:hypothetical protein BT63DRAFT_412006 [Microthyrium microscopicum]
MSVQPSSLPCVKACFANLPAEIILEIAPLLDSADFTGLRIVNQRTSEILPADFMKRFMGTRIDENGNRTLIFEPGLADASLRKCSQAGGRQKPPFRQTSSPNGHLHT